MTAAEKEYGSALYALAAEEHCEEEALEGLALAAGAFSSQPEYRRLVQNPALPAAERLGLLDEAFGGVHPYVLNFIKILCEKSALGLLDGCLAQYRALHYEAKGILPVEAVSAVPLTRDQLAALQKKLEGQTGMSVLLENRLDPGVLGGIKLRYSGRELDGTASGRLAALRRVLLDA